MPSSSRAVGTTSARIPPSRSATPSTVDDQRHRIGRVGGVGAAVGLEHLVGVAVVGGHEQLAAGLLDGLDHLAEAAVDRLDRLAGPPRSRPVCPTMSGLAKLMIPKRNGRPSASASAPVRGELLGGGRCAHLGLEVVGRHVPRGVHQAALLARDRAPPPRR